MHKNKIVKKIEQNKAFTLQELLIVLALMVVLLAISTLTITNWNKTLKMTELENYAKTIYLEAQYQLTAMEVEGGLPSLYETINADYSHHFLTQKPHDYDTTQNGDAWKQLCYVTRADAVSEKLFAKSTNVYNLPGSYLIEFNPQTGDVYGVFYWEESYELNYSNNIMTLLDRGKDERMNEMIGYYGGDIDSSVSTIFALNQDISVVNGEELYIKVSFEDSPRLEKYYATGLSIVCQIQDEHGNRVEFDINDFSSSHGERLEFYLLLDSMAEGKDFASITGGALVAGENLTVTVECDFEQGAYEDHPEPVQLMFNSLYASKTLDGSNMVLEMSAVRHLRNLDEQYWALSDSYPYVARLVKDIDFNTNNYAWTGSEYVGVGGATRPINAFTPIENNYIDEVDGAGYVIRDFVIRGQGDNVGLFATAGDVVFNKVCMLDTIVKGESYNNVGTLVGYAKNSTFRECAIYLSTTDGTMHYSLVDSTDSSYTNEMERRYDVLCVTGGSSVGGLVGNMEGSTVSACFAAVKVNAASNAGGLVGKDNGSTLSNSYASGAVYVTGSVGGGFIGKAMGTTVSNAYTTSDLYVNNVVGGFVGQSENGQYSSCYAYGKITDEDGSSVPATAGGFVGSYSGDTYSNCTYLQQENYNNKGLTNPSGVTKQGYTALSASSSEQVSSSDSYGYSAALVYSSFPFKSVTGTHYGNWPSQYFISTSLVYYEVYSNGEYGYYCETTFEADEGVDSLIWVLDSLQDIECVEDGYALLSMYNLAQFSYNLHIGSVSSVSQSGVLTVADSYSADADVAKTQAIRLRQQGALFFNGYSEELDDYTGVEAEDVFVVDGMYLYQLPYDLQCTGRFNVANFYDKFVIYNGLPKLSTGTGTTPVVGGSSASDGVSFFYCPHFAKTAVNPNTEGADATSLSNPSCVYVRSARQLNALGRYSYYWNSIGGLQGTLNYVQETDINFGTYNKTYCGQSFDLMKTDQEYSNVPIGKPGIYTSESQFRHSYDGQGKRIIDYCVESTNTFVGLFGEIYGATLKNIVMTVSEENAGKISAYFNTGSSGKTAVGALVGLAYEYSNTTSNTITNCSASGYEISFTLDSGNASKAEGVAMGGLVGMSMSSMSNCAAANNIILYARVAYTKPIVMGGLAGSSYFGTLSNSYAGGSIDIVNSSNYNLGSQVAIGGVCPGYMYTWYDGLTKRGTYKNLYSYTTIKATSSNYDYLIGTVGKLAFDESNITNNMTISNCYYLADGFSGKTVSSQDSSTSKLSYSQLCALSLSGSGSTLASRSYPIDMELLGLAYPFPAYVKTADGTAYVHYGDWIIGDESESGSESEQPQHRPRNSIVQTTSLSNSSYVGIFYYELYDDGTYGVYAEGITSSNSTATVLINTLGSTDSSVTDDVVQESGYGVFYKSAGNWTVSTSRNGTYTGIGSMGDEMTIAIDGVENYNFDKVTSGSSSSYTRYFKNRSGNGREITISSSEFNRPTE